MDLNAVAEQIRTALGMVLDQEDFDVVVEDGRVLDVATDEWTIHIEDWPDGIGWFALDDEPDDPSEYARARRAVMSEAVERALAEVDRELGGAITRSLDSSGDPFSQDFAAALRQYQT
ncbi:MAG: hypothetical protein KatS3mg059_0087 [Thermomicrobiales bacterium]|nr:MAG: hypothetical protein KatS3mg059_0087 [Thermomicrobiales bacterium]